MDDASVTIANGAMTWNSEGVYLIGDNQWQDMNLHVRMDFDGTPVRLVPRYLNRRFYLQITIEHRTIDDDEPRTVTVIRTEQYRNDRFRLLDETLVDTAWTGELEATVETQTHHFLCTINGTEVANIELPGMVYGRMGVYGPAETQLYAIEAEGDAPEGWTLASNPSTEGVAFWQTGSNGDPEIVLKQGGTAQYPFTESEQDAQTVSVLYQGTGHWTIHTENTDGATDHGQSLDASQWTQAYMTMDASSTLRDMTLEGTGTLRISRLQVENTEQPGGFPAIGKNAEQGAIARLPADGVTNPDEGACSFWLSLPALHETRLSATSPVISSSNGAFQVDAGPSSVVASWDDGPTLTVQVSLPLDTFVFVYVAWGRTPSLHVWNGTEWVSTTGNESAEMSALPSTFAIGAREDDYLFGLLEDMRWYRTPITRASQEAMVESDSLPGVHPEETTQLDFDYRIATNGSNDVDVTRRPRDGSPVLVETNDGHFLQQVSFVDPDTGDFRTWNEEPIIYDRHQQFLGISYDAVTDGSSTPVLRTSSGAIVGDPVKYRNGRWYPTFSPQAALDYHGQTLYVTYHARDSYTVDPHLDTYDTFRVSMGDHQGEQVSIHHEGSVLHDTSLQATTDLNPLTNTNHRGFMYVTDQPMPVNSFRIKASPRTLPASHAATSIITVEPLDEYGNPTNDCLLDVTASHGTITAYADAPSVVLRYQSGQYLYRYRTPLRTEEDTESSQLAETIFVKDRWTGYGVQLPMTLLIMEQYPDQQERPSSRDERMERERSVILGVLTDHWGLTTSEWPDSIGDALDLDGDGVIGVQDITALGELPPADVDTLYSTIKASDLLN